MHWVFSWSRCVSPKVACVTHNLNLFLLLHCVTAHPLSHLFFILPLNNAFLSHVTTSNVRNPGFSSLCETFPVLPDALTSDSPRAMPWQWYPLGRVRAAQRGIGSPEGSHTSSHWQGTPSSFLETLTELHSPWSCLAESRMHLSLPCSPYSHVTRHTFKFTWR